MSVLKEEVYYTYRSLETEQSTAHRLHGEDPGSVRRQSKGDCRQVLLWLPWKKQGKARQGRAGQAGLGLDMWRVALSMRAQ